MAFLSCCLPILVSCHGRHFSLRWFYLEYTEGNDLGSSVPAHPLLSLAGCRHYEHKHSPKLPTAQQRGRHSPKHPLAEVTPWAGSQDGDSLTPGHITCGMVLPQTHLSNSFTAFILCYANMKSSAQVPHRAPYPCTFYKPLHQYRNHTAAPHLPLRGRGPWPRFFISQC